MKIHMKFPSGAEYHFEREPMKPDQFETLCWTTGVIVLVLSIARLLIAVFG